MKYLPDEKLMVVLEKERDKGRDRYPVRAVMKHEEEIEGIFDLLVEKLKGELADFGEYLAIDGKAIESHANGKRRRMGKEDDGADGRRDGDGDWGKKVYRGVREDGTAWEKVKSWFGCKLQMVVDATYELPVSYRITTASGAGVPAAHELFEKIEGRHPEVLGRCKYGLGDRGVEVFRKSETIHQNG